MWRKTLENVILVSFRFLLGVHGARGLISVIFESCFPIYIAWPKFRDGRRFSGDAILEPWPWLSLLIRPLTAMATRRIRVESFEYANRGSS